VKQAAASIASRFLCRAEAGMRLLCLPALEGDKQIGRIDMKADGKGGSLDVKRLWLEPGVRPSTGRLDLLDAELQRIARFSGVEKVAYLDGWRA